MLSKKGCEDVLSGAMAKRGAWLRQKILCLAIPAMVLKSTLKSGTPANPKIWSKCVRIDWVKIVKIRC